MRFACQWVLRQALLTLSLCTSFCLQASEPTRAVLGGDYWTGNANQTFNGREPLWGFVDLHAHFFNHLGSGGQVFHGAVYSPLGVEDALKVCHASPIDDWLASVASIGPEFGSHSSGWPTFEGWPRYSSLVHQQAYVDWIRRAWEGGLRLVQMDAGNSRFLSIIYKTINPFLTPAQRSLADDDAHSIRTQISAAVEFVKSGPGRDFAEIALSARDARRIISQGKLAIVLGIEVEALGNLVHEADLGPDPRSVIRRELKYLYSIGVRHIIPIHLTTNAFGNPAIYDRLFDTNNFAETGKWFEMREGFDSGIRFNFMMAPRDLLTWASEWGGFWSPGFSAPVSKSQVNALGLTPAGEILIDEMMKLGILIDIDHMSDLAVNQTLEIAEAHHYPLQASHTGFRDLAFGAQAEYSENDFQVKQPDLSYNQTTAPTYGTSDPRKTSNERIHSREQVVRLRNLGGMVGVGLGSSGVGVSWRNRIPLDCDGTTKSFAQAFQYAVEVMGGRGIAIGSDVNGFAGLPPPRFGVQACAGLRGDAIRESGQRIRSQALAQKQGVSYDTPIDISQEWRFHECGDGWGYDAEERAVWEALASFKAKEVDHLDPHSGKHISDHIVNHIANPIDNMTRGFLLASQGKEPPVGNDDQLAAYEAYFGREYKESGHGRVLKVWRRWKEMESSAHPPLKRYRFGKREFDINLDGMAHYGLLPDFLQDVVNVGITPDQLSPLFRGAEDYVRMWEKAERYSKHLRTPEDK